jgi:hypothetical protein
VFSLYQLTRPWGSPIILPNRLEEEIPEELKIKFQTWLADEASDEDKILLGASVSAYQLARCEKTDEELAVRLYGPRMKPFVESSGGKKNFRGRVYVGIGRNLVGDSAMKESNDAHKKAEENDEEQRRRDKQRGEKMATEGDIITLFRRLNILSNGKPPTKSVIQKFAQVNSHLLWPIPFPLNKNRPEQVKSLLALLAVCDEGTDFRAC